MVGRVSYGGRLTNGDVKRRSGRYHLNLEVFGLVTLHEIVSNLKLAKDDLEQLCRHEM